MNADKGFVSDKKRNHLCSSAFICGYFSG